VVSKWRERKGKSLRYEILSDQRNFKVNLKRCRTNTIKHASYSYSNTRLDHPYPGFQIQRNKERRRLAAIKQEISKYHCITREPEALLKLYSRELSSTIDPYKNTKTEYIYSEQFAPLAAGG
jgi:hypothetical protein